MSGTLVVICVEILLLIFCCWVERNFTKKGKVAIRMIDENGAGAYTSGCPTYAACNGDISPKKIVKAWREMQ